MFTVKRINVALNVTDIDNCHLISSHLISSNNDSRGDGRREEQMRSVS